MTTDIPRDWRDRASCLYEDADLWYPDSYVSAAGLLQIAEAKRICAACPVLWQCYDAVKQDEGGRTADGRHGIRAGLTPKERFDQHRRQQRHRQDGKTTHNTKEKTAA